MHDPMTVAFKIKYPWKQKPSQFWPQGYRDTFITIWHVDPEKDGTDDSCGWFKRSRHGNKEILQKIEREFAFELYNEICGIFNPDGSPRYSSLAITLMLFQRAAHIVFNENRRRADRFMKKHFYELVVFAENSTDSLHQGFNNKYGVPIPEDRIKETASIVYGWILRTTTPWYKHPRWHVHHWKIQIHPFQKLKRYLFERCCKCGKGYSYGYYPMSDWHGTKTWHQECDDGAKIGSMTSQAGKATNGIAL